MPPTVRHRRPPQRPTSTAPSPLDRSRWMDHRSGLSIEELAARENVKISTIQSSLDKMKLHAARTSQESVDMATRELYLDQLPSAIHVFEDALKATTMQTKTIENPDTEETEIVYVEVPDHAIRLKAIESLQKLLAGVTPKTPMVQVDARTQINNPGQPQHVGQLSSESIIRQIRAERGLSLTAGDIKPKVLEETPAEIDFELQHELEEDAEDEEVTLQVKAEYVED